MPTQELSGRIRSPAGSLRQPPCTPAWPGCLRCTSRPGATRPSSRTAGSSPIGLSKPAPTSASICHSRKRTTMRWLSRACLARAEHPNQRPAQTVLPAPPVGHAERRISLVKRCAARTTARDVRTVAPRAGLIVRCGSMASSSRLGGAEQPVLVPVLRWFSPARAASPAVLRPARRFVPSAGRRDKEPARPAGHQVVVAASGVVQPDGVGHRRR
jgi:hypothetical protein